MSEDSRTRYDRVPFPGRPVPWATPSALSVASTAAGGPSLAADEPLRVLELGCGDGAHLLGLAAFRPQLRAVGLDDSEGALAAARAQLDALGMTNVELRREDLATAVVEERGYDVVLAHGVYSWVDAERRDALRRICAAALRDGGLAYVSFNAQPGWSVRGRVRDLLVRGGATVDDAAARLDAVRGLLPDEPRDAWSTMLLHEVERAGAAAPGYLAHEYLSPHNAAFWLGDVVADFADAGLTWCGDALFDRAEGYVPEPLRELVDALGLDRVARAEHVDLRMYRQLHGLVFARGEVGEPPSAGALMRTGWIAGALRRRSDPFDIRDGMPETFDGPPGREVQVSSATTKMALLLLADRYPVGTRLDDLYAQTREKLAENTFVAEPMEKLAAALGRLHRETLLELRHEDVALRVDVPERPEALAITRYEVDHRDVLTTPTGSMLPIEPIDRALVTQLDGSATLDAIADAVTDAVLDGTLALEGAPAGAPRVRAMIINRLTSLTTLLGWWGLLDVP